MNSAINVPDKWELVELKLKESGRTIYKVLGDWNGGYLQGTSWRLSSNIVNIEEDDKTYKVTTVSGSTYLLNKTTKSLGLTSSGVYEKLKEAEEANCSLVDMETVKTALEGTIDDQD